MKDRYIKIGTFQKPVGLEGELKVEINEDFTEEFVEKDHVFVLNNGNYVPWFIEDIRFSGFLIVKLEEVDTPEEAARFNLADIFIKTTSIKSSVLAERMGKQDLSGFTIFDGDQILGVIEEVVSYPGQELARFNYNQNMILIPLADPLIIRIDEVHKKIFMSLPEGLYD